jgi:hypothetical protein
MVSITAVTTICQSPAYGGTTIHRHKDEDLQGRVVPARECTACRKVLARRFVLLVPLSGETRVRRVRTNNKTGVGHFAFLYLSENYCNSLIATFTTILRIAVSLFLIQAGR